MLVDFWSTTCGPCIGEIPNIKAAYQKLHDCGLEVVGISLDRSEGSLRWFMQEKELPWAQHFDGKGWQNRFAVQYGIFRIPTMWLLDKSGNLRDTNARGDLERRAGALLQEVYVERNGSAEAKEKAEHECARPEQRAVAHALQPSEPA